MNVIILQEVTAASTPHIEASRKQTKRQDQYHLSLFLISSQNFQLCRYHAKAARNVDGVRFQFRKLPQRFNSQQPWSRSGKFKSASSKQKLFRILRLTLMLNDMVLYMSAVKKLLHLRNLPLRVEPNQVHKLQMIGFV